MQIKSSSQDQSGKVFTSYFNCYSFPSGSLCLKRERRLKPRNHHLKKGRYQFQSLQTWQNGFHSFAQVCQEVIFYLIYFPQTQTFLVAGGKKFLPTWVRMELIFLLQSPSTAYLGIWYMAGIEDIRQPEHGAQRSIFPHWLELACHAWPLLRGPSEPWWLLCIGSPVARLLCNWYNKSIRQNY